MKKSSLIIIVNFRILPNNYYTNVPKNVDYRKCIYKPALNRVLGIKTSSLLFIKHKKGLNILGQRRRRRRLFVDGMEGMDDVVVVVVILVGIRNDAALFLFIGWEMRQAIQAERIHGDILGGVSSNRSGTRERGAANGDLLEDEVALGLVVGDLAVEGGENAVAAADGIVGAGVGFENDGGHGDGFVGGGEVLDNLQDVADAEELVGVEEILLVMGREIWGKRTIRGASSALVFTCGASLGSGGAVVVASPAVHPFLEFDFYSFKRISACFTRKVYGVPSR